MPIGSTIKDLGGKRIALKTKNGSIQSMNYRVADVTKALASVNKICQGRTDDNGRFIENKSFWKETAHASEERSLRDRCVRQGPDWYQVL